MPPVYVINLKRCPDRLEFMTRQLESLGVEWSLLEAVDAAEIDFQRPSACLWLTDTEVAVWRSHQACWRQILASNARGGVVLEDDVHLSPSFAAIVTALEGSALDLVKLETGCRKVFLGHGGTPLDEMPGARIDELQSWHGGAAGYFVSSQACRVLLAVPVDRWPVDVVLFDPLLRPPACCLTPFQLSPAVVVQDQIYARFNGGESPSFSSTIMRRTVPTGLRRERGVAYTAARLRYKLCVWTLRILRLAKGWPYQSIPFEGAGRE
jgi:GR25 family glycosyltransferase involved in LPS biosynthesis